MRAVHVNPLDTMREEIDRLRAQVAELHRANNAEVERRRGVEARAAFLADLWPDQWCAVRDVVTQWRRVKAKHQDSYADAHHGYGILAEEVAELFDEVRKPDGHDKRIRAEAKDVAVVSLRMMLECSE